MPKRSKFDRDPISSPAGGGNTPYSKRCRPSITLSILATKEEHHTMHAHYMLIWHARHNALLAHYQACKESIDRVTCGTTTFGELANMGAMLSEFREEIKTWEEFTLSREYFGQRLDGIEYEDIKDRQRNAWRTTEEMIKARDFGWVLDGWRMEDWDKGFDAVHKNIFTSAFSQFGNFLKTEESPV